MNSMISFSIVAFSLLLDCALATNLLEDGEDRNEGEFSYTGARGASNWGKLRAEFAKCSKGKFQSPININTSDVILKKNLKHVAVQFVSANATLYNSGHVVELRFEENIGSVEIYGKKYFFKQLHWHTPSEHLINGIRFPAEVHLVHEAKDDSLAVIGILYQFHHPSKSADPLLTSLEGALRKLLLKKNGKVAVGVIDTKALTARAHKFYRYAGSLTTPPCTENVIWTVLGQTRLINEKQVAMLKAIVGADFKNNGRPQQPLNGRKVGLYNEKL